MIEPAHQRLSIAAQGRLLLISRSSYYCKLVPEAQETLALMRVIDAAFLDMPWTAAGRWSGTYAAMATTLGDDGCAG